MTGLAPVVAAALALAFAGPAQSQADPAGTPLARAAARQAAPAATCTSRQKRTAQATLAAYRKAMLKQRAAYFKRQRKPGKRKAFVKKQQRKLKALQRAAACTVRRPAPRTPPAPPPVAPPAPPVAPPVPRDTTAPTLDYASVDGPTVRVRFSEGVAVANAAFAVYVNGVAWTPHALSAQAETVVLTLPLAVAGDDAVALDYRGGVQDAAGNAAAPAVGVVVANATPTPCSYMVGNGGLSGPGKANEGATETDLYLPAVGTLRGVILWIDFPDAPATESILTLEQQIVPPAVAAYAAMSYGKLQLDIDAVGAWYRLPQPSSYYGLNAADGAGRKDEYIAAAVHAADATVDFSQYDVVYLVPAAGASADQTTATQRPPGSGLVTVDGTEIRMAVLLGSERLLQPANGAGAVIHETGHVFGLPDLYADPTAVGGWDPMSFSLQPGAELMAWHRWKLGWLEPSQLRCVQPARTVEATLTPLELPGGLKQVVAPIDATRALVVENRQLLGLDARLCDKGVLVYIVDGGVAFPGTPIRVLPAWAGSDTDEDKQRRCGPRYDAPLDLGPGEISSLHDPATGVRVELVAAEGASYVVRVSR